MPTAAKVLDLGNSADQIQKVATQTVSNSGYNNYISGDPVEHERGTLANDWKVSNADYATAAIKSAVLRSSIDSTQIFKNRNSYIIEISLESKALGVYEVCAHSQTRTSMKKKCGNSNKVNSLG